MAIASLLALTAPAAGAAPGPDASAVAALQVALTARGLYHGPIDGAAGAATAKAVARFQELVGLVPDGALGPRTREALGPWAVSDLGARPLVSGLDGWDVAQLQFRLAWRGFPSGPFDGRFGARVLGALVRFQQHAGLPAIGVAGPATVAALDGPLDTVPIALAWPVVGPLTDLFGPRGDGFHPGLDIAAPAGTPVGAAAAGRVAFAGWRDGGYGNVVVVARGPLRLLYAHLDTVAVAVGDRVVTGDVLGSVGSTGRSSGPHLHFEARVRGAAVDPEPALTNV